MKISRKLFTLLTTIILAFGTLASFNTTVNASTQTNIDGGFTREASQLILDHLTNFTDSNGNLQVKITNPKNLKVEMKKFDLPLTFEELETTISKFNYYMAEGDNVVTETAENIAKEMKENMANQSYNNLDSGISTMAISCGDALSVIGLLHSGSYATAAFLLGISTASGLIIPLIIAAAYTAASIACD